MSTSQELQLFASYVQSHLATGNSSESLEQLFDRWHLENNSPAAHRENVAAVAAAVEDFKQGDRGRPAGELSQELRARYRL